MFEAIVGWSWVSVGAYLGAGVIFAAGFLPRLAGRLDPAAREGSLGFRVAVFSAMVALWPLLACKLLRARDDNHRLPHDPERPLKPATQRRIHGAVFVLIALLLPILGFIALWTRTSEPFSKIPNLPAPHVEKAHP
jgi:hypothetical protein